MIKYLILGTGFLCLFNIAAYAAPSSSQDSPEKGGIGLGLGAILGGLIGGPPGAIIGAAGGALLGESQDARAAQLAELEARLQDKETELTALQSAFERRELEYGAELQKVNQHDKSSVLESLTRGVLLSVYFRTDSFNIDPEMQPGINKLADYLKKFPEIQIHLDAHADQRGSDEYNRALSRKRADAVKQMLVNAGLDSRRIQGFAHGETMAAGKSGDTEGFMFDRRVSIQLSLDQEKYASAEANGS